MSQVTLLLPPAVMPSCLGCGELEVLLRAAEAVALHRDPGRQVRGDEPLRGSLPDLKNTESA